MVRNNGNTLNYCCQEFILVACCHMHLLILSTWWSSLTINSHHLCCCTVLTGAPLCWFVNRTLWQVCVCTAWGKQRRHGQCAQLYLLPCSSDQEEPAGHYAHCKCLFEHLWLITDKHRLPYQNYKIFYHHIHILFILVLLQKGHLQWMWLL